MLDGLAHDDEAGQQGLLVAAEATVRGAVVVHLHLASAVQDLETSHGGSGTGPKNMVSGEGTPTQARCHPTFQVADLRLTVRPLLVTVHFILMKKSRSVDRSLLFFPKPEPGQGRVERTAGLRFYVYVQKRRPGAIFLGHVLCVFAEDLLPELRGLP